ncbi:hypothetical protein [Flagellimonas meishanensis]|uniref:hypothetical protein n=1 Tax=Flagellimonas meishanensis TaxID=2873264 RepID=UPI001CA74CE1|nr:hypothetical protein [[Muricauda] meishanensis]
MKTKNIFLFVFAILFSSCNSGRNLFKPYGSWITANSNESYQLRKAPGDNTDIRVRRISSQNFPYSFYKQIDNDSIFKFEKIAGENNLLSMEFETEDKGYFKVGSNVELAYRMEKKEEPSEELLNEAIAREVKRRYPLMFKNFNSGKINGNAWRFENCDIKLSKTGIISISGRQKVSRCTGFTGRVVAILLDEQGNELGRAFFKGQGIDPKSFCKSRTKGYNDALNFSNSMTPKELSELIVGTYRIQLYAERSGSGGQRITKVVQNLSKISDDLANIGANVQKIYSYF